MFAGWPSRYWVRSLISRHPWLFFTLPCWRKGWWDKRADFAGSGSPPHLLRLLSFRLCPVYPDPHERSQSCGKETSLERLRWRNNIGRLDHVGLGLSHAVSCQERWSVQLERLQKRGEDPPSYRLTTAAPKKGIRLMGRGRTPKCKEPTH